ncbi:gustatory receptor for bitter taste 93a [Drosophila obscura]|uniref:gustatory receptor for bitter taste 93a n=1 Tax=Drosophila obscura TaxID=7282 RepID=UPI001BB1AEA9|nr:gustatory receptor for bitter taste 93a [Drosophila obscura]
MAKYSQQNRSDGVQVEAWSRGIMVALYRVARLLSLISFRLDREELQLKLSKSGSRNRILETVWRILVILTYAGVWPQLSAHQITSQPESYADLFVSLQSLSVSILAVLSFIIQAKGEDKFRTVLNRYLALYRRICAVTGVSQLFPMKFIVYFLLKSLLTIGGCVHELPPLLKAEHFADVGRSVAVIVGIYMWLGTLFVLDACFMGFLVSGILYEHMASNIQLMLQRMQIIECQDTAVRLSNYQRMRLLCDYADELDERAAIYSELYEVTIAFRRMLQWQILFYVYYNFISICLMLYQCILSYLNANELALVSLAVATIKLLNLILLIMCADYAVRESQKPNRLPLDIVCTDMDQRWDKSVEIFLSQMQTQRLEIKVLGFFHLNNEFILLILSATISYLFILIQFGITGGFEASDEVRKQFNE